MIFNGRLFVCRSLFPQVPFSAGPVFATCSLLVRFFFASCRNAALLVLSRPKQLFPMPAAASAFASQPDQQITESPNQLTFIKTERMLREQLRGTGVAIITPFAQDGAVDFAALENLIDLIINGGVEYIVTLGTTGETPVLSSAEKKEIIGVTMNRVAGRVPVVIGMGGNNTAELVKELESYPLDNAVAVLSASPYYNKPSQEGIIQHYKKVAEASPKPVILYNVPARTGRNMSAATTLTLANVKNIGGIKEASGDMAQCMEILRDRPDDFLVVSGDDALALPQLACGMDGVISVAANVYPQKFSQMVRSCLENDYKNAKMLNDELIVAYNLLFAENNPAGAKAFLAEMKHIQNVLRLPGVPVGAALQESIHQFIHR